MVKNRCRLSFSQDFDTLNSIFSIIIGSYTLIGGYKIGIICCIIYILGRYMNVVKELTEISRLNTSVLSLLGLRIVSPIK